MFPTVTAFQKIKYSLFHIHLFYKIIFDRLTPVFEPGGEAAQ